jgi:hypothetical protein
MKQKESIMKSYNSYICIIFIVLFLLISACVSSTNVSPTQNSNKNQYTNVDGSDLSITLVKFYHVGKSVYQAIFELENNGDTGIFLTTPVAIEGSDSYYIYLEDYGGFNHDMIVSQFELAENGEYKILAATNFKLYPKKKALVGGFIVIPKKNIEIFQQKTLLHFSMNGKTVGIWDVTNSFIANS